MSTYIDTSTSVGLVLSGTPQNPVTIGSSGTIAVGSAATAHNGDAIYGNSVTAWTVSNFGTVKAAAAASTGIELVAGGTVTNAVGALIAGAANGIRLAGSADLVSNAGAITATSGAGVYLAAGGRVSNLLGGVISGMQDGVVVAGGAIATVSNFGKIAAYGTLGIVDGVYIGAGTITNGNSTTKSALISSTQYGIVVAGTTGAVSNFGTVRGTGTAGVGIYLQNRGSVSNALGALISGGHAGILMKGAGTVSNLGMITGTDTGSAGYVDGVYMNAGTVVNGATNVTTALISGVKYGVVMYGSAVSTVRNFGTIVSTAAADPISKPAGILMNAAGIVVNGATNARKALIFGGYHGIYISGSSATTVTNFGTVQGIGASGDGIDVSADAGVSVISNSGTVNGIGTDGRGIDLFAANVSVSNAPGGLISGDGAGIFIYGGGTVTNSGTVTGRATKSIGVVLSPSAGAASVSNGQGGMISGGYHGVRIYGPGRVSNLGTITGGSYSGVYMQSGTVVNQASGAISGLISGVANGVVIIGTAGGTVSNAGRIQGTAIDSNGIRLEAAAASVVNASTGLIIGGYNGVEIEYGNGTVTNYGRIVATAAKGDGVYLDSGMVTNFGTVTAGTNGTGIYLHSGDVTNFGTIIAPGASGKAVVVRYGTFFNYGVIAGSVYGIKVSP
ncbi:MAG TPA: hypothetical protein VKQ73_15290, partial [Stellaceae bacterium]|nr:hypothetical protein [Stellaceae bacterium]